MRAGGAGIPAFFTPAGVGSPVADGGLPWRYSADGSVALASPPEETRVFGKKRYVLEQSITANYSLVHAQIGDTDGNLVFNKSAMNFNPLAAMAGRITIAQVEELVQPGELRAITAGIAGRAAGDVSVGPPFPRITSSCWTHATRIAARYMGADRPDEYGPYRQHGPVIPCGPAMFT